MGTGGSGKFVLVTEFFYGGVRLVDVEEQTFEYIVPTSEVFTEKGGVGLTVSNGHIFVAGAGPTVGLPFEIYVYNPQGELVTTCVSPDVTPGLFNDFAVVGDVAYVTDSDLPRLWNFNIPDAISGNCVLNYDDLDDIFNPAVTGNAIESNGIVSVGDGFIIALFGGAGLYYVNPTTNINAEVVPLGTYSLGGNSTQPDGLELVEEDDGTATLYVTVGVSNNIFVYEICSQDGTEVPKATLVGTIENEAYDTPSTSAIIGDTIYTANLRGQDLPFFDDNVGSGEGEDSPDAYNEQFSLVATSRRIGAAEAPAKESPKEDKKEDKEEDMEEETPMEEAMEDTEVDTMESAAGPLYLGLTAFTGCLVGVVGTALFL